MKKITIIYFVFLLLFLSCDNENDPFNRSEHYSLITVDIGEVRDLDYSESKKQLFVGTESEGIYIFGIDSISLNVSDIPLFGNDTLTTLYENIDWGIGKDIRSIQYSEKTDILYALDRFEYTYHNYVPYLLGNTNSYGLSCPDTLIANICAATQTHATKFALDDSGDWPELHILYKHNADNELYTSESYSTIKLMEYVIPPQQTLEFCDFIGVCENESISFLDTLGYKVNDMYFSQDKIYIANPRDNINSFEIYQKQGNLIDSFETDSKVKSIFSSNNYIVAGTQNGCYITLLEENGISDSDDSKLKIAENFTVYDIYFDSITNKLILSTGADGVLIYNWDGNSLNVNEEMRLYSSYAFTARIINDVYYVATKNGLEIYNIGD